MNPTINQIQEAVCSHYGLTMQQLLGDQRGRFVAWPRQIAMHLCMSLTYHSLVSIGNSFNRDHTTAMHARDVLVKRFEKYPELLDAYNEITKKLLGGAKPPAKPRLIRVVPKRKKKATAEHFGFKKPPQKRNRSKYISKPAPVVKTQRACLGCGSNFMSEGKHNRLCSPCGRKDHDVFGVAA